jgi:hypothetical protein
LAAIFFSGVVLRKTTVQVDSGGCEISITGNIPKPPLSAKTNPK